MKIINKYIIGVLSASLLITACAPRKKYARTQLDMPQTYREQVTLTGDTVLLPWRNFFNSPALAGLIEKALEKNNDIAVAMMNMEQLDLTYKQAKLTLLPSLDFNASANRQWLSKNSLNGSLSSQFIGTSYLDDYSATLRLSWEADIWGKAKMQKEAALNNYFAQKENLSALKTRIIVQVAQAYYNLIALDEQLKIAQRNVQLSDSTLNMLRLQYKSGQVNSLAVEQTVAQKKTAELLVPLANQNIVVQENALNILCGSYPNRIERTGTLATITPDTAFTTGVPALLLSRRPDVKAAEFAVVSANSKTGLAKAAMYPTLSLSPSVGTNSFNFNSWFNLPGSLIKNVGANLTAPIFNRGQLKTSYKVALLDQQKAVVQFKQSVLTAVGEVSDALARSKNSNERLVLVAEKNASLKKATKDALLLYRNGMATYLEVITAQNNALQNDLEAIEIKKERLFATTDLYRALGGGVSQ